MVSDNKSAAEDNKNTKKQVIGLNGRITANPVVSCRVEGDEGALLFNPDSDNTVLINPVGIKVWNFISQPRTVEEIIDYVSKSFRNSPDQALVQKDIVTFVTDLGPDFISEV